MNTLRPALLPLALLLTVAACKKDQDKEPSKTDMLTTGTWKDSQETLQLNSTTGTRTPAASSVSTYQFGRDGKLTVTPASGPASTGTWAFANNETQLTITKGSSTSTFEVFELSKSKLTYGYRYDQAQIQAATSSSGSGTTSGQVLLALLLSASYFTFPAGTATIPTPQLTSVQWSTTAVAQ